MARASEAPRFRPSYKVYLFLAMVVLSMALVAHSHYVIRRLNEQARSQSTVLARFVAVSTFGAAEEKTLRPIFLEVIRNINFPMILTDTDSLPRAWKGIGIPTTSVPDSVLARADSTGVVPPLLKRIQETADRLDRVNKPIEVVRLGHPGILGYVHYGEPPIAAQLRWIPYFEFGGIVLLLLFGFAGYRGLMTGEQRSLWAALAKETAHQLGTPLSSLMGWTSVLREGNRDGTIDAARIDAIADEMDRDLDRLHRIVNRFAQVGATPVLVEGDLTRTVAETVAYIRSRLPTLGRVVSIEERYEAIPPVRFHRELIAWVVENLLKNALDAADKPDARIEVSLFWRREDHVVELRVRDNGRGMTAADRRRALTPGFTTKRRGWGLGLALARRVVREYHRGKISIVESAPGRGTTVAVALPVPPKPHHA
ncbi:MAG: sensor histidine kinase [Bacteroidota bacterium]